MSTFEREPDEAAANLKKPNVSFREGSSVLADPLSITILDPDHSTDEQHFIDIGLSAGGRILVVV